MFYLLHVHDLCSSRDQGADQGRVVGQRIVQLDGQALVYCVYTPVSPSTEHWAYDPGLDHVTADVWIECPDLNPCQDRQGARQVSDCIGANSNFEILVDTASYDDGAGAGLSLSEASTELRLILADGTKVHLHDDQ